MEDGYDLDRLKVGLYRNSFLLTEVLQQSRLAAHGGLELEALVEVDCEILGAEQARDALNEDTMLFHVSLVGNRVEVVVYPQDVGVIRSVYRDHVPRRSLHRVGICLREQEDYFLAKDRRISGHYDVLVFYAYLACEFDIAQVAV